jgi:long-chain fatty acid transport protein
MLPRFPHLLPELFLALTGSLLLCTVQARAQGIVLPGVGAVNRSMGGAATAAPLDACGAIFCNPASVTGLARSEMEIGAELLFPQSTLSSGVAAGALGPAGPPVALFGSDRSQPGVFPLPTLGVVYKPDESPWAFGLGAFVVGGLGVNYPASTTNPILTPQPPRGVGLGALFAQLQVLQLVPTVACQLTDRLSVGLAPTLILANLSADPLFVAPPDAANGSGFANYEPGTHSQIAWGGGFQAGIFYKGEAGWNFGGSFKSTQWAESFRFNSTDELGRPLPLKFHANYPMIVSAGAGYTGLECWTFALDVRYLDYKNTPGFSSAGFDPSGAARGLGWDSTFLIALGVQYQIAPALALRLGYDYGPNPIPNANSSFNVASSSIIEHSVYIGASYSVTETFKVSMMYSHGFRNAISGPLVTPAGPVPSTFVRSEVMADSVVLGAQVQF